MTLRNSDIHYEPGQACWLSHACSKHGSTKTRQSKLIYNIITKNNGSILFTGSYHVFDKYAAFSACMTDVPIVRSHN